MIDINHSINERKGFTLLEVLVAFSLLSILFAVLIQSQADSIYFLEKSGRLAVAQKEVMNELLKIERNLSGQGISSEQGTFPEDHVLPSSEWKKEVVVEDLMGIIKIKKITYRISWTEGKEQTLHYFESTILGQVR